MPIDKFTPSDISSILAGTYPEESFYNYYELLEDTELTFSGYKNEIISLAHRYFNKDISTDYFEEIIDLYKKVYWEGSSEEKSDHGLKKGFLSRLFYSNLDNEYFLLTLILYIYDDKFEEDDFPNEESADLLTRLVLSYEKYLQTKNYKNLDEDFYKIFFVLYIRIHLFLGIKYQGNINDLIKDYSSAYGSNGTWLKFFNYVNSIFDLSYSRDEFEEIDKDLILEWNIPEANIVYAYMENFEGEYIEAKEVLEKTRSLHIYSRLINAIYLETISLDYSGFAKSLSDKAVPVGRNFSTFITKLDLLAAIIEEENPFTNKTFESLPDICLTRINGLLFELCASSCPLSTSLLTVLAIKKYALLLGHTLLDSGSGRDKYCINHFKTKNGRVYISPYALDEHVGDELEIERSRGNYEIVYNENFSCFAYTEDFLVYLPLNMISQNVKVDCDLFFYLDDLHRNSLGNKILAIPSNAIEHLSCFVSLKKDPLLLEALTNYIPTALVLFLESEMPGFAKVPEGMILNQKDVVTFSTGETAVVIEPLLYLSSFESLYEKIFLKPITGKVAKEEYLD